MLNDRTYILKEDSGTYPYEIMVYDPRSEYPPPEWFTDILKLDKLDENGNPMYQMSIDKDGGITYQVPSINGHINVLVDYIIARNTYNDEVFPMRIDLFESKYKQKRSSFIYRIMKFIKK